LLFIAAAGGAITLRHGWPSKNAAEAEAVPPSAPIVAGTVAQHDVPIYLNGVGTVIAYNTVVVRAQIQGQITSINFTEGQQVHTGDLLAQIGSSVGCGRGAWAPKVISNPSQCRRSEKFRSSI
jgi:multidrug efflux system membrane fusion protein